MSQLIYTQNLLKTESKDQISVSQLLKTKKQINMKLGTSSGNKETHSRHSP